MIDVADSPNVHMNLVTNVGSFLLRRCTSDDMR